jgi:hypothetical protein
VRKNPIAAGQKRFVYYDDRFHEKKLSFSWEDQRLILSPQDHQQLLPPRCLDGELSEASPRIAALRCIAHRTGVPISCRSLKDIPPHKDLDLSRRISQTSIYHPPRGSGLLREAAETLASHVSGVVQSRSGESTFRCRSRRSVRLEGHSQGKFLRFPFSALHCGCAPHLSSRSWRGSEECARRMW